MKEFYHAMPKDKVKINWNKKPIRMDLFLSFLTVDVERSNEHLGSSTGWTLLTGQNKLEISGGVVNRVEYLNSLMYGRNLYNDFNNFVNPFYLFEILNEEGKLFFLEYYATEINEVLQKAKANAELAKIEAQAAKEKETETLAFWNSHTPQSHNTV